MQQKSFTDQMHRKITLNWPPNRIVSLVPSQTELLFDLGLDEEVVGITKFCVHPKEKWRTKPRIGGTKKLHLDKIAKLHPDLIIGNKEENEKSQIEALAQSFPVWMSDISTLEDALQMIDNVGIMTDKATEAKSLSEKIRQAFAQLPTAHCRVPTAYFIWRNPWMVAGGDTFINSMLEMVGCENVFSEQKRYPEITLEELQSKKPAQVLLSSEPYPFSEKHIEEVRQYCPEVQIKLVDGEMFSWYGSRLLLAASYFKRIFV